jgi:predicted acyltransferase
MVPEPRRLLFLDVFRGLTLAFMIIVVTPGSWAHRFAPLRHAAWDGLTPTDLVFPFFLFIVGVSMVFSLAKRLEEGERFGETLRHVVRRSAILFALGLFISFDFVEFRVRIPGVLQRIAVCFLATALIAAAVRGRAQRLGLGAALLAVYGVLMKYVPVPEYGAGRLTLEGNMAGYIDSLVMKGFLYMPMYEPGPDFDPEGLVSTLPAIVTTLLGYHVGEAIREKKSRPFELSHDVFLGGTLMALVGYFFTAAFPLNKALWSPSYAIVTAGMAALLLGLLYWIVEMKQWRSWTVPFEALGANTIGIYWLSSMTSILVLRRAGLHAAIVERFFTWDTWPEAGSLAFAVAYLAVWTAVAVVLQRRRIFIKV